MAERVDPGVVHGGTRLRAWASGPPESWRYREVAVGTTRDGRWYASRIGQRWTGTWACTDEREACELVQRWMGGDQWQPTPARFDGTGKPCDGETWFKSGGQWFPGEKPGGP